MEDPNTRVINLKAGLVARPAMIIYYLTQGRNAKEKCICTVSK